MLTNVARAGVIKRTRRDVQHLDHRRSERVIEEFVRLGAQADIDRAVDVYERSNLERRRGVWPKRTARIEQVRDRLRDPDGWFLVADDGNEELTAMAAVVPYRADDGTGPPVPGVGFLSLIFVVPERWGEGIGATVLRAVLAEARRRGNARIILWTHEQDNERAHRLYRSARFQPTGRTGEDDEGAQIGEWARDLETLISRR